MTNENYSPYFHAPDATISSFQWHIRNDLISISLDSITTTITIILTIIITITAIKLLS